MLLGALVSLGLSHYSVGQSKKYKHYLRKIRTIEIKIEIAIEKIETIRKGGEVDLVVVERDQEVEIEVGIETGIEIERGIGIGIGIEIEIETGIGIGTGIGTGIREESEKEAAAEAEIETDMENIIIGGRRIIELLVFH